MHKKNFIRLAIFELLFQKSNIYHEIWADQLLTGEYIKEVIEELIKELIKELKL